ncbi:hypothetical protein MesoLjLc_28640 [Mesorhizobium sp. L-8-10]|uniref:helix-turn-helix domain-containing protein n=1 Tax=Mesorhizobium sp. L-8-10 TaxID=2744523 RepID=UPI0019296192|nr:helix-turn-helix domain-containing protein [Mesorhizobium sp. L-8-10]BCH30934.1 hypothetical protein MesoLjLc_28640 [Mesorhizobium sp. L-8-10]
MQFEEWDANLKSTCGHYDSVPGPGRRTVNGHFTAFTMCGLDVANLACDIDRIDRTHDGIRRDETEYLFLLLQLSGSTSIEQHGRQATLAQGDFYLLDSTRTATLRYECTPAHILSLHLPRASILLESEGRLRIGEALDAKTAAARRLHRCFRERHSRPDTDPEFLFDLARLAFSTDPGSCDAGMASSSKSRFELAMREMESSLTRPELSLAWLARRVGISERQLQRDFLARGSSFVRLLRDRRLRLAAEIIDVAFRAGRALYITEVALAAGFRDLSNFNRAFRSRFGCTPSEYAVRIPRRQCETGIRALS